MPEQRRVDWQADSLATLQSWNDQTKRYVGDQLRCLQFGEQALRRKMWKGSGWNGFELRIGAFRVVGTLEDPDKVTVFHCFRKDAKKGNQTRKADVVKIEDRHKIWKTNFNAAQQKQPDQKKAGSKTH